MKNIILILFTVAIASVNALAQEPAKPRPPKKSPEERAENITKRMTKELNLNADQEVKAKSIILKRELDMIRSKLRFYGIRATALSCWTRRSMPERTSTSLGWGESNAGRKGIGTSSMRYTVPAVLTP